MKQKLQNQTQQVISQAGGLAMKQETQGQAQVQQSHQTQQQGGKTMLYFVTFPYKLDKQKTQEMIRELRNRFPGMFPVFMPKPPSGRRFVTEINGITVILTFPQIRKDVEEVPTQAHTQTQEEGFTIRELLGSKKIGNKKI
jgi:hypothetical protein